MRNPNVEIVSQIKAKTLELLMEKEPSEIGMRDIAAKCGVTAANIYHYFKAWKLRAKEPEVIKKILLKKLNRLPI